MRVYFDHNATTPVDPAVVDVMVRVLREDFGNASSVHRFGQQAKAILDDARSAVATLIGADPSEVVFTSGGTEADNAAIRGAAEALEPTGRRHLIASSIEHEAVLVTLKALARRGWRTTLLPVDASGVVSPAALEAAITDDTALVSVMHANNELGTIQPVAELARLAHSRGALFHTDAVQSVAKASGRRAGARRGSAGTIGAQIQRSEGCGGALDQARNTTVADTDRRQTRTHPPRRYRERGCDCRIGSCGTKRGDQGARVAGSSRDVARSPGGADSDPCTGDRRQRCPPASGAEHDQHQLRSSRSGITVDRTRPATGSPFQRAPHARRGRSNPHTYCGPWASRHTGLRTRSDSASVRITQMQRSITSSTRCPKQSRSCARSPERADDGTLPRSRASRE